MGKPALLDPSGWVDAALLNHPPHGPLRKLFVPFDQVVPGGLHILQALG